MARNPRDLSLERRWRRHIERQEDGGWTIRRYCQAHRLHESAFYFWRRTLADRDAATPAFVPVTVVDAPATTKVSPIDIHLARGRRIRVRAGCDRELLAVVLAVLEAPAC